MTDTQKTRWHRLLGKFLEELLVPVGIAVYTEFPVMNNPPEVDILLLRKNISKWTKAQLERLPDGIRDSKAEHILIEFKYTESINEKAFRQTLAYDTFYRRIQKLPEEKVQTFLVSAKTPRKSVLDDFQFVNTKQPGVYQSHNHLLRTIPLLLLNELSSKPHNAFIRCFASRKKEKLTAFNELEKHNLSSFNMQLQWFITGLWKTWFQMGGQGMDKELTPEKVIEMGKMWGKSYLASLPAKERLKGLKPAERLEGLKPAERLKGLNSAERLEGLSSNEIKEMEEFLEKYKQEKY